MKARKTDENDMPRRRHFALLESRSSSFLKKSTKRLLSPRVVENTGLGRVVD
jgi:hypothetical protein